MAEKTMQKSIKTFVFLMFMAFGGFVQAQTIRDQVILKTGDIVTGKITLLNDSILNITSPILGDLVIKKMDIESINFNVDMNKQGNTGYRQARPLYNRPVWTKATGFSIAPLGVDIEICRAIPKTSFSVGGLTGIQVLSNYDLMIMPLELVVGFYPDSSTQNNFVILHVGTSFRVSNTFNDPYIPGAVYGFSYRHIFPRRADPQWGTYFDVGYRGGVLKKEFLNWQGELVKRQVQLNRLKLAVGLLF